MRHYRLRTQVTIFAIASGILGISISLNALSTHATCTATFVAVASLVVFMCASIRTLGRMSWLAWAGLVPLLISGKSSCFNHLLWSSTDELHSLSRYHCRQRPRPTVCCTEDQPGRGVDVRLETLQQTYFHRRDGSALDHRLCLRWHAPFLSPRS